MSELMSDYILVSKYLRYSYKHKRRETWDEAVDRVLEMHYRRTPKEGHKYIKHIEPFFRDKRIMPSMRSLQYAGPAIEKINMRMYNCVGLHVQHEFENRLATVMYCLMCGSGVGVRIPNADWFLPLRTSDSMASLYIVEDTIEGWADSMRYVLQHLLYTGKYPNVSYSKIRPKGTPIHTGGGLAPGPEPLQQAHENMIRLVRSKSRLQAIDIYDIIMFMAEAVLSGGVRRSAVMILFDPLDKQLWNAKTGNWLTENPQRAFSNNSAHLIRGETDRNLYNALFEATKQFGEPGLVFFNSKYNTTNPCAEIEFTNYDPISNQLGLQVCNLTTINGTLINSASDLYDTTEAATILGTLQAQYTNFNPQFINEIDTRVIERDRLLGVSICGIMDSPTTLLEPYWLRRAAALAKNMNSMVANTLKINPAQRITTVKPEGTASLVLRSSAGIHPRPAHKYIRRVQANKQDPITQFFLEKNPVANGGQSLYDKHSVVLEFPVLASKDATVRDDKWTAKQFLENIKLVKENWCGKGSRTAASHNVSNTISVKEDEWSEVKDYIWKHQNVFGGLSMFPDSGDSIYPQQPEQPLYTQELKDRWNQLIKELKPVDYTELIEDRDHTQVHNEFACIGGSCTI